MTEKKDEIIEQIASIAEEAGMTVMSEAELAEFMDDSQQNQAKQDAAMVAAGRVRITEDDKLHEQWYATARTIRTPDELKAFIESLTTNYIHDYGTICHAASAAAVAAAWCIDKSDCGGITGFQAGCIMWGFIQHWLHKENPLQLVDFGDMLYPQYGDHFNTLSPATWKWVQEKAAANLKESPDASRQCLTHWHNIVLGVVPFGYRVEE